MHRVVLYCRKSTDRDDKQQNSIEAQLSACTRTIEKNNFTLVDTFIESASAKKSGKRSIFDSMLALCKRGNIDYIIVDEASRLSRNSTDSAKILGLLEEKQIEWIYTTSQNYFWEQASELFMLLLNFGMAKLDNDTRARNIKSRMITCAEKWRCLWKAPFGYKNVTILKDGQVSQKGVLKDPLFAPIVERIFRMRWEEKKTIADIANICQKEYSSLWWKHRFTLQWIDKLMKNPFYIWMIRYAWKTYVWEHESIISTSLFKKAQELERWFYSHDKSDSPSPLQYLYKWIIKDSEGIALTGDIKQGKYIYYRNQNLRSSCKVNISEKRIEECVIEKLADTQFPIGIYELCLKIGKKIIDEKNRDTNSAESDIEKEISQLNEKEKRLMNGYLEWAFEGEAYKKTSETIGSQIVLLEARKKEFKKVRIWDFETKAKEMFELLENLSKRYKLGSHEEKQIIHRKLQFELFVNHKKELTVEESKPFKMLRNLNCNDGNATENWTPVYGMKTRCLNHWTMASNRKVEF